ncbi:MAG: VOC family protein [Gemmatimonadota bacterium]
MKTICIWLCLATPVAVHGQPADSSSAPFFEPISGAFFALSVADVAASAEWYSEKLGLEVVIEVPKRRGIAVTVLEGAGLIVELIEHDQALPLRSAAPSVTESQYIHGISKVGVVVEDFDRTIASLRARGVEIAYGPFPAQANQRANAVIRDNSGNLIQFFGR